MSMFIAIADAGSLSAAGRQLDIPLATVSRKLTDLEAHLKTRLITRSTRRLKLTEPGREYLAACRQILERIEEAERAASGAYASAKGELVVAAPVVFGRVHVVPVVAAFLEAYPDVDARLILGDRNVNLLEGRVAPPVTRFVAQREVRGCSARQGGRPRPRGAGRRSRPPP